MQVENCFVRRVSNVNGGKVENCSRIKDGNGRLALEQVEAQMICKRVVGTHGT